MKNSEKFFMNTDCRYYPCHEGIEEINCLFCYCPLYHAEDCPGRPAYKEKDGHRMKICTGCTFPHEAENYDEVIRIIRESMTSR